MASSDKENTWPLIVLNTNGGSFILRLIFLKFIQLNHNTKEPSSALNDNKYFLKPLNRRATKNIKRNLFPNNTKVDINDWDITVLCYVIKNCCSIDGKIERSKLEEILDKHVTNINDYITQKKTRITSELKNKISESQENILYPEDNVPTTLEYWDASLLVRVLIAVHEIDKCNILPKVIQHFKARITEAVVNDAKLGTPNLRVYLTKHMSRLLQGITGQSEISRAQFDNEVAVQQPDVNKFSNDVIVFIALNVWPTLKLESSIIIKQIREDRNTIAHLPSTTIDKTEYETIRERQIKRMDQLVNNEIKDEYEKWEEIVKESQKTSADVLAEHTKRAKRMTKRKTVEGIKEILAELSKRDDFHIVKKTFTVDYLMCVCDVGVDDTDEKIKQKFKDGDDDAKPILGDIADRGGSVTVKDGSIVLSIQVESLKNLKEIIEYLCDGDIQRQLDLFTESLKNTTTLSGEIADYSLQTIKETLETTKEGENLTPVLASEFRLNDEMNQLVLYGEDDDFEGDDDSSEQSSDGSDDEDYDSNDRIDQTIYTRSTSYKEYRSRIGSKVENFGDILEVVFAYNEIKEELLDLHSNIKEDTVMYSEMLNECDNRCIIIKGNNNSMMNEIVNLMFKTHLLPVGHRASFSGFIRILASDNLAVGDTKAKSSDITNERIAARFVRSALKKLPTSSRQTVQINWPFKNNMLQGNDVVVDTGHHSTTDLVVTEYMPRAHFFAFILNAAPNRIADISEVEEITNLNEKMGRNKRTMSSKYAQFFLNRWDFIEWEEEKDLGMDVMSKDEVYKKTFEKLERTWPEFQPKQATKISFTSTVGRRSNWLVAGVDDGDKAIKNVPYNTLDNLKGKLDDIDQWIDGRANEVLKIIKRVRDKIEKAELKKYEKVKRYKIEFETRTIESRHTVDTSVTTTSSTVSNKIESQLNSTVEASVVTNFNIYTLFNPSWKNDRKKAFGMVLKELASILDANLTNDIKDTLGELKTTINNENDKMNEARKTFAEKLAVEMHMKIQGAPLSEVQELSELITNTFIQDAFTTEEIVTAVLNTTRYPKCGFECKYPCYPNGPTIERVAEEVILGLKQGIVLLTIQKKMDPIKTTFGKNCDGLFDAKQFEEEHRQLHKRGLEKLEKLDSLHETYKRQRVE